MKVGIARGIIGGIIGLLLISFDAPIWAAFAAGTIISYQVFPSKVIE